MNTILPSPHQSRRGRVLVALFVLLVPGFAVTALTTRAFHAEQQRIAAGAAARGELALGEGRPAEAIDELRLAQSLAPTRAHRLRLAQALAAAGRESEARAHLLTLREAAPGDGVINLELARIASRRGNVARATHYYRDAVEGAWATASDTRRRETRLELAELLVRHGPPAQAEGELIALAADLPPDPALHVRVGDLLMQARLSDRAFDLYAAALHLDRTNVRAMQGAGESAFALANYGTARRYFARVASAEGGNAFVLRRLETVNAVLALDPFARGLAARERARRARLAFEIASKRLATCGVAQGAPTGQEAGSSEGSPGQDLQALASRAAALAPRAALRTLARDPDALDEIVDWAFRVEETAAARCAGPVPEDEALVLLARDRRATER